MKKIIAILLALCLCIALYACGHPNSNNKNTEPTKSKAIELNSENISQYLNIKIGEAVATSGRHGKVMIEFYPLQAGNFANVEINLHVGIMQSYILEGAIGADLNCTDEYPRKGTLKVMLPADGRYEIELQVEDIFSTFRNSGKVIHTNEYTSVSGTFTPTN